MPEYICNACSGNGCSLCKDGLVSVPDEAEFEDDEPDEDDWLDGDREQR